MAGRTCQHGATPLARPLPGGGGGGCGGGAGAMSGRALPLLFLNLGGEMLYILDQRLRAQSIPGEKARKGEPGLGQGGRHRGDPVWALPCPAL